MHCIHAYIYMYRAIDSFLNLWVLPEAAAGSRATSPTWGGVQGHRLANIFEN